MSKTMNIKKLLLTGVYLAGLPLYAGGNGPSQPYVPQSIAMPQLPASGSGSEQQEIPFQGLLDGLGAMLNHPTIKGITTTIGTTAGDIAKFVGNTAVASGKALMDEYKRRQVAAEQRLRDEEEAIAREKHELLHNRNISDEARKIRLTELTARERAAREEVERWKKLQTDTYQSALNAVNESFSTIREQAAKQAEATIEYRKEAIKAQIQADGQVRAVEKQIQAFTNPENLMRFAKFIALASLGFFGARYGTELLARRIEFLYRNPELAQETSLKTVPQYLQQLLLGKEKQKFSLDDVVLGPDLAHRIQTLSETVKNIKKHKGFFRHALFSGPPGTGKTMVAKLIAYESGIDYVYFSGSSLRKYPIAEALIKIDEVFNDPRRRIIVIDECEQAFKKRELLEKQNDTFGLQILDHILTLTGTESKNFMLVGMTNRPELIDDAFLSRCDERVLFKAPSAAEVKRILRLYIVKWLMQPEERTWGLINLFKWTAKKKADITLKIEEGVLSEATFDTISQRLADEGFVGRDISKLVIAWKSRAYATKDGILTAAIIEEEIAAKINKKRADSKANLPAA